MTTPAKSPFKPPRFAKSPGRKRTSAKPIRLTPHEHETFRRMVLGGERARPGRLRAWAEVLERELHGDERIAAADKYAWIAHRVQEFRTGATGKPDRRTILFSDAAKIYVAGLRARSPTLDNPADWLMAVNDLVPNIHRFHHGYGIPGRMIGHYDKPLIPMMLPTEYVGQLAEELANVAIERDQRGTRARVGEAIEQFFTSKISFGDGSEVSWNFSATYAIEQIVMTVMFESYYRGWFGPQSGALYNAVNNVGIRVAQEVGRMLADPEPGAFARLMKRLGDEVELARKDAGGDL